MTRLEPFRSNLHSQNGEDGVIAELVKRMNLVVDGDFWCVEFGAWDGVHLSNTFALVQNGGASAVYIEGDGQKFDELTKTASRFPSIIPVKSFVIGSWNGRDSLVTPAFTGPVDSDAIATLDEILKKTKIPREYDLLSIDIDSFDLEVWEAHDEYSAKIVVIEINSSVPPGVLQWHGPGRSGNSFSSTLSVAERKGYSLVCHTGNLIFVKTDMIALIHLAEIDKKFPERLFNYSHMSRISQTAKQRLISNLQAIHKALSR